MYKLGSGVQDKLDKLNKLGYVGGPPLSRHNPIIRIRFPFSFEIIKKLCYNIKGRHFYTDSSIQKIFLPAAFKKVPRK